MPPVWLPERSEWIPLEELRTGDLLDTLHGHAMVRDVHRPCRISDVYNIEVHGHHVYRITDDGILVHNKAQRRNLTPEEQLDDLPDVPPFSSEVTFGENFAKKVRKHIDQIRNRGPVKDPIPSPGKGGIEAIEKIIRDRVAQGGGQVTQYAGESAVKYLDGGVTYIFRPNGEFWTILGN